MPPHRRRKKLARLQQLISGDREMKVVILRRVW
jgi:hypothetical protein